MKISKATLLKLGALACFSVGIERTAHGRTMADNLALSLGSLAIVAGILLAVFAFRLERNRK